jgi:hypothetical protein
MKDSKTAPAVLPRTMQLMAKVSVLHNDDALKAVLGI